MYEGKALYRSSYSTIRLEQKRTKMEYRQDRLGKCVWKNSNEEAVSVLESEDYNPKKVTFEIVNRNLLMKVPIQDLSLPYT